METQRYPVNSIKRTYVKIVFLFSPQLIVEGMHLFADFCGIMASRPGPPQSR
jgi:hypothetical protein